MAREKAAKAHGAQVEYYRYRTPFNDVKHERRNCCAREYNAVTPSLAKPSRLLTNQKAYY